MNSDTYVTHNNQTTATNVSNSINQTDDNQTTATNVSNSINQTDDNQTTVTNVSDLNNQINGNENMTIFDGQGRINETKEFANVSSLDNLKLPE